MAYIVVYQRDDGSSGLEECADIDLAIVTAERLRNVESIERPRILKTEEITYDFRPYYRVEVMAEGASETVDSESAEDPPPPPPPAPESDAASEADGGADVDAISDVEVVEDDDEDVTLEEVSEDVADEIEDEEPVEEADEQEVDEDSEVAESEDVESPGDTPTVTTSGGLFGDRSPISDRFPSSGSDNDPPSSSTRRGLFGR